MSYNYTFYLKTCFLNVSGWAETIAIQISASLPSGCKVRRFWKIHFFTLIDMDVGDLVKTAELTVRACAIDSALTVRVRAARWRFGKCYVHYAKWCRAKRGENFLCALVSQDRKHLWRSIFYIWFVAIWSTYSEKKIAARLPIKTSVMKSRAPPSTQLYISIRFPNM